jgi:membrane protein
MGHPARQADSQKARRIVSLTVDPATGAAEARPGLIERVTGWPPLAFVMGVVDDWNSAGGPRLAAAIAYFSALSIAPLVIITLAIAGLVFGPAVAQQGFRDQLVATLGQQGADVVLGLVANADQPGLGSLAAIIGVVTLLFAAGGLVGQLQESLDILWDTRPEDQNILEIVLAKLLSIVLVALGGGALIVTILAASLLGAARDLFPGDIGGAWQWIEAAVSLLVTALIFAVAFRVLPHAATGWRALLLGGALTALLFAVGKYALTVYITAAALGSSYGSAASFVVLLVWIFYSAQIVLLGAAATRRIDALLGGPAASDPPYWELRKRAAAAISAARGAPAVTAAPARAAPVRSRATGLALTMALLLGVAVGALLPRRRS